MTRQVMANPAQSALLLDLCKVFRFHADANPGADSVELIAVLGAVGGTIISSAPTEGERTRARNNLVMTLDRAIADFLADRRAAGDD